jgi:hypothetical protein
VSELRSEINLPFANQAMAGVFNELTVNIPCYYQPCALQ